MPTGTKEFPSEAWILLYVLQMLYRVQGDVFKYRYHCCLLSRCELQTLQRRGMYFNFHVNLKTTDF